MVLNKIYAILFFTCSVVYLTSMESPRSFGEKLFAAVTKPDLDEVMRLLILNCECNSATFHFFLAIARKSADTIEKSLQEDVKINIKIKDNIQPIHMAVFTQDTELVSLLIEHGANIRAKDVYGKEPLHYAAYTGNKKVINLLISLGADITSTDNSGQLAKNYAHKYGHSACAKLLNPAVVKRENHEEKMDKKVSFDDLFLESFSIICQKNN